MDLVLFVLSVVGICGSIALFYMGVSTLHRHNGNSVSASASTLKSPPENGKSDLLTMLKDTDHKLSGDEQGEIVVAKIVAGVPEQKQDGPLMVQTVEIPGEGKVMIVGESEQE